MKKNYLALAAGIASVMLMAAGCGTSQKAAEPSLGKTEAQATQAAKEETETTEAAKKGSETIETQGREPVQENPEKGGISDLMVPVKIWGSITKVTDRVIYVDNQSGNSAAGEMVLEIDPETTWIIDGETGYPLKLQDLKTGSFEAYLGPAMTMSLPPQCLPYLVMVNAPEDHETVQYVIAAESIKEGNGEKILVGNDGTEYPLAKEVTIAPFLTKQIVQLEDVEAGSSCLVWRNEEDKVEKILLFNE